MSSLDSPSSSMDYASVEMGFDEPQHHPPFAFSPIKTILWIVVLIIVFVVMIGAIAHFADIQIFPGLTSKIFPNAQTPNDNNLQANITSDGHVVRQCTVVETMCPGEKNCRGPNGQVTGAMAVTPDGSKCCMFACESQGIQVVNQCKTTEKYCGKGQACRMGDTIMMPTSITVAGNSCCRYDCDEGDVPVRAPFSSETVCPMGSYCLDFEGKPTAPKARTQDGAVICQYSGDKEPCVKIN